MSDFIRLNKHLAHTTGISRRQADELIAAGKVWVNHQPAQLGAIVQPTRDTITVENKSLSQQSARYTYLLMNKPTGFVCSRKQQGEVPTIYSLLPREYHHLKVAGRLDKDSCGLLLLTDDGDTIFKLTHPKFQKEKTYIISLNKPLKPEDEKKIQTGVQLEDGPSKFKISRTHHSKPNTYKVTMHEGRNRQIRRTLKALGYTITHLERISFGVYSLSDLREKTYLQIRNKYVKITT